MSSRSIPFGVAEAAFEAAREREHTDFPEPTQEEIEDHERRYREAMAREPKEGELKIMAYLEETGGAKRDEICEYLKDDLNFKSKSDDGNRYFWALMVDNALDWLWRTWRIKWASHGSSGYGVRSRSYFPLSSNLGRMCPPEKRENSVKIEIFLERSDDGVEAGFCVENESLHWSDEEWGFLPYIREGRKTKAFKSGAEAIEAVMKHFQEYPLYRWGK